MDPPVEHRRHKRFAMTSRAAKLTLFRETESGPEQEDCILLNLSYSGMGFRALRPVQEGEERRFLIDLQAPVQGLVRVKALVRWVRRAPAGFWDAGAIFVESTKGWLGPGEE